MEGSTGGKRRIYKHEPDGRSNRSGGALPPLGGKARTISSPPIARCLVVSESDCEGGGCDEVIIPVEHTRDGSCRDPSLPKIIDGGEDVSFGCVPAMVPN